MRSINPKWKKIKAADAREWKTQETLTRDNFAHTKESANSAIQ